MGCQSSTETATANSSTAKWAKYEITVKTSGVWIASGTRSSVHINMFSENNETDTGWLRLDNVLHPDFQKDQTARFRIKAPDVGVPLIIQLELRPGLINPWACSSVTVKYMDEYEAFFPVYDWITDNIKVARGEALTPADIKNQAIRNMRSQEIDKSKHRFEWIPRPTIKDVGWGLPRYVNETSATNLPGIMKPSEARLLVLGTKGFESVVNAATDLVQGLLFPLDDLDSYKELYKHLQNDKDPEFILRWATDEEFGRQQLNTITPLSFQRCKSIPSNCQITNTTVADQLPSGCTLDGEMEQGKVYIGDYSQIFKGVKRNKNLDGEILYCPDAICIYYVNPDKNLVPIAIQLEPNDPDTIFTPRDSEHDWLLAKMYFRVAMGNLHEWYYHFLMTHNVMETFAVSVFRCFPRSHPLYKLLRPHLQTVTFINALARSALIPPGSQANKALAIEGADMAIHGFKNFQLDELVIPEVIKKKGLDDGELLPKFYYRDDALQLWSIIENFVSEVVGFYYSNDEEVGADLDVQAFAKDMANEGLGWQDGNTRGMPTSINTTGELVRLCTIIVFTSSVQHATVNFQQYEVYKFIPNAPVAMRLPPHKKGEATMDRIMRSLPNRIMSAMTITIAYTLSSYSPDDVFLGNYVMDLFCEEQINEIEKRYRKALNEYAERVKQRNENVQHPYTWLLPDKIPNSIAI